AINSSTLKQALKIKFRMMFVWNIVLLIVSVLVITSSVVFVYVYQQNRIISLAQPVSIIHTCTTTGRGMNRISFFISMELVECAYLQIINYYVTHSLTHAHSHYGVILYTKDIFIFNWIW
ncbi:MAG: hypothetical protein ACI8RD_007047, partial [Bacillariaceae sp.]